MSCSAELWLAVDELMLSPKDVSYRQSAGNDPVFVQTA